MILRTPSRLCQGRGLLGHSQDGANGGINAACGHSFFLRWTGARRLPDETAGDIWVQGQQRDNTTAGSSQSSRAAETCEFAPKCTRNRRQRITVTWPVQEVPTKQSLCCHEFWATPACSGSPGGMSSKPQRAEQRSPSLHHRLGR